MRKVTIFAARDKREEVFERLRDLGAMQITRETENPSGRENQAGLAGLSASISTLGYLKDYFLKYNPAKKSFIDMFTGKKPEIKLEQVMELVRSYDIEGMVRLARSHEERLSRIDEESAAVSSEIEALSPWQPLDIPLKMLGAGDMTENMLFTLPLGALPRFEASAAGQPIAFTKVWEARSEAGIWAVGLKGSSSFLASLVAGAGGSPVSLPLGSGGTVGEAVQENNLRLDKLRAERESLESQDKALSQDVNSVLALMDYYLDKKNLAEVGDSTKATRFALVIEGWVKASDMPRLRAAFDGVAETAVVDEEPAPDEEIPIYLENPPIIRPFEVITNIFGYPKYNEIDPTPFLAPFFWLFFGICLGDAVYGIVLWIGAYYFLRTQKLGDGGQKLVRLLMYGGLSSILAGALTGSWMSDLVSAFAAGSGLERVVNGMAILNPVADPLTMLVVSFGFGILQVWVGIGVKMLGLFKQGQYAEGVISCGSWLVFLPGLIVWAISKTGMISGPVPFYIMIAGALMVMYSSSRGQKNILMKPFSGLYGLYGTVSYFADTMSYSRLLALGLASTIIGMVVNKIAGLVVTMVPTVGWVIVPVILVGGHTFNLVINVLGSFIHAGRLQFVEFFTKFFEGGGRPFRPLTRVTENVSIDD